MPKKITDKTAFDKFIQGLNNMIDNANTLIEGFEKEWSAFGKRGSWNIGELIDLIADYRVMQALSLTKHPFHRPDLERHEVASLIEKEYERHIKYFRCAIFRGIWHKAILVVTPQSEGTTNAKETREYIYSRVAMTWDYATFRLDDKYVDPQSFLKFAEKECLDIPDRLLYRGLPATTLKSRQVNTNRGNEALWRNKHVVEPLASIYIAEEVLRGCTCRHDKLAYFTLENAKDDKGILLKDYNLPARYNFRSALNDIALTMVPKERQYGLNGNSDYNPEKCICALPEHQFAVPHRKKTQVVA